MNPPRDRESAKLWLQALQAHSASKSISDLRLLQPHLLLVDIAHGHHHSLDSACRAKGFGRRWSFLLPSFPNRPQFVEQAVLTSMGGGPRDSGKNANRMRCIHA